MPLLVDGKAIEHVNGSLTLSLHDILEKLVREGRYIETVTINGQEVTAASVSRASFQCEETDQVEVTTCTLDELVNSTMESSFEMVPKLYRIVEITIAAFRQGRDDEGIENLSAWVSSLQWHADVLGNFIALQPGPSAVHELNDELQTIVPKLYESWNGKDFVLLADVMEYELAPWLERWYATVQMYRSQMRLEELKHNRIQ